MSRTSREETVNGFTDEYYFLSNMYPCAVTYHGHEFKCSEAAFQVSKHEDWENDEYLINKFALLNGYEAKAAGKKVALRADWERVKDSIMEEVVEAKFSDDILSYYLKLTEGVNLIEYNRWGDSYWGVVIGGSGKNRLGKILMKLRCKKLREQEDN